MTGFNGSMKRGREEVFDRVFMKINCFWKICMVMLNYDACLTKEPDLGCKLLREKVGYRDAPASENSTSDKNTESSTAA